MSATLLTDRPKRNLRRPLFFSNENHATVFREFSDAQLEYYSYILRKKWADSFLAADANLPGHIKVVLQPIQESQFVSGGGTNTSPTFSSGEYLTLATAASYTNGAGGIEDRALIEIERIETKNDNNTPPPGADLFQNLNANLRYKTTDSFYNFMRNEKYNNQSALDATIATDYENYGYITVSDAVRSNTTQLVISNSTVLNAGTLDLETLTFVDGLTSGHKLILEQGTINQEYRLRQVGGYINSLGQPQIAGTEAEEYVVDAFFKDVEEKIRNYDVGAVRIDNFQEGGVQSALANIPGYEFSNFVWSNAGVVYTDTRYDFITGTNPYDLIYEYNMYVCTDLTTPMSPPSYNGREIKALKTILGNDQLDGRRIQEMSNDINGDFITNFLYKIFLRRYPVYDFSTTGNDGAEMGFVTDTYYNPETQGSATQSFYNTGSWGSNMYVRKSILDSAGTEHPTSEVTFFVFKGLRGDTPTYYNTL